MFGSRCKAPLGIALIYISSLLAAQEGFKTLSLEDLSDFRPQAGNWQVAGSVLMDRNTDVHSSGQATPAKGKKKKGGATPPSKAVSFTEGTGILLNQNTPEKQDALITTWEHGDIELELEVMLPKGSNSGIYLQGRYEIQLFDSWGIQNPTFSDMGGIYRNWESDQETAYMGKSPLSNAAKAPGLWQALKISFIAPKFDESGKKISNARFNYVDLNGVRIHENIEVPQMTGGPLEAAEAAIGPLMIQGDHGPVAFRNIRYKLLSDLNFDVSEMTYEVFAGSFDSEKEIAGIKPVKTGKTEGLTWEMAGDENEFTVRLSGFFDVPKEDSYSFTLTSSRHSELRVQEQIISQYGWNPQTSDPIVLKAGKVPFTLLYFKDEAWFSPRLGLSVNTLHTHQKALQTFNSLPIGDEVVAPIFVSVGSEPRLLRAFLDFRGDPDQRLTHTIGVGDPSGAHYIYDMKSGSIACVWKGAFVDATPMWHDRGDGSFMPMGAAQYLFTGPSLAVLGSDQAPFPASYEGSDFKGKGYWIGDDGRPVFGYMLGETEVSDKSFPGESGKLLRREITVKDANGKSLYYRLAAGKEITRLADGSYLVDGSYYISSSTPLMIREAGSDKELICPVSSQLQYDIVW